MINGIIIVVLIVVAIFAVKGAMHRVRLRLLRIEGRGEKDQGAG